jgi:hypothetical protein
MMEGPYAIPILLFIKVHKEKPHNCLKEIIIWDGKLLLPMNATTI